MISINKGKVAEVVQNFGGEHWYNRFIHEPYRTFVRDYDAGITKMKKHILDRYCLTEDNKIIIDIAATKVENLYNDLDKHAPFRKKELDQELVNYLIDSTREIGGKDFVIQFRFAEQAESNLTSRVQTSIHNYFQYLIALEFRELARMTRSSLILLTIGVVILFLSVLLNEKIAGHETAIANVFAEGLNVAAWVSLWNAIASFLIDWAPRHRQIKMYQRIAKAPILFEESSPDHGWP